nr:zinc finger protein 684 [Marmota flaviventris]
MHTSAHAGRGWTRCSPLQTCAALSAAWVSSLVSAGGCCSPILVVVTEMGDRQRKGGRVLGMAIEARALSMQGKHSTRSPLSKSCRKMINLQESVTFQDVAVDFTSEERQLLDCDQRSLPVLGCDVGEL